MTKHVLIAESLDITLLRELPECYPGQVFLHEVSVDIDTPGIHLHYRPEIADDGLVLADEIARAPYEILSIRPYPVHPEAIDNAPHLKGIIREGAGVNSIAVEYAAARGIWVANTPGENSVATAEFTWEFITYLAGKRRMLQTAYDVRQAYDTGDVLYPPTTYIGEELEGKTLAIIGLGAIGREMRKRAEAFGMKVIGYSRNSGDVATLEEALQQADMVTLHTPLTAETTAMLSAPQFVAMKPGAILINTARPQLVDPQALDDAVAAGIISGFAFDGDYDKIEPYLAIAQRYEPRGAERFLCTHHIADSTHQAMQKLTRAFIRQLLAFYGMDGDEARVVNRVR